MIRRKVKRFLGLSLVSMMIIGYMPCNTYAVVQSDETSYLNIIEGIKSAENQELKLNQRKISEEVDIETEEKVSIIVQFVSEPKVNEASNVRANFNGSKVERDHEAFKSFLGNIPSVMDEEGGIEIKYEYKEVYNGMSLSIKGTDIPKLLECDVVKNIYNDSVVTTEPITEENYAENEIDTAMIDSLPFLNIDDLHEEGITGAGIKVGVLDTGIDYNHPDLKSVYKGFKAEDGDSIAQDINAVTGWDFVDNDADPMETTYEDWLASGESEFDYYGNAYYTEHGTHVSGTIAATGENTSGEYSITGVAPNVELYGYRVLGPRGSGATAGIIGAIEKSVTDGMDVINLSLGNSGVNTANDPMVDAVNNATLAGVVTVIAAGNAGPTAFTVGAPGTAALPIVVGASSVEYSIDTYEIKVSGSEEIIAGRHMIKDFNTNIADVLNGELSLVYCGIGTTEDFATVDVKGKIAVIDRGDITFVEKANNAKANGAILSILINNDDSSEMPYVGEGTGINTISISKADGDILKESLAEKKVTINKNGEITVSGDTLAEFSSVGPVAESYDIRPDVVAPGVQVFSTVPEYINNSDTSTDDYSVAYARMSGTSMATPHVSGIAALILQANPEYSPEDVKAALMNTSERIYKEDGTSYSVNEIGAGRVAPYEAVYEKVDIKASYTVKNGVNGEELENVTGMIAFGKVSMDENETINKTVPVTITNDSAENKVYEINVEYLSNDRCDNAEAAGANLSVPSEITVASKESVEFMATLNLPAGAYGSFEGYINIVDKDTKSVAQIPFSVACKKSGFEVLDYPNMGNGYAKGISAFTTSMLYNRDAATAMYYSDISFIITVNDALESIYGFVKDYETGEYIGYAGSEEGYWIPEGVGVNIENFVPNGRVKMIKNGNVTENEMLLESGIYELEVVAETADGDTFTGTLPMAIINDDRYDSITTDNVKAGITEINEEMFTTETWSDGKEYEGIWIKGNIHNSIVQELKDNYGMDYLKQGEVNMLLCTYNNGEEFDSYVNSMTDSNGDFMLGGIERSDFEKGYFKFNMNQSNAARLKTTPKNYILVDPSRQYLSLDTAATKINEEEAVNFVVGLNNAEDIAEGDFQIKDFGDINAKIKVEPTEELKKLLKENGNEIEISYEKVNSDNLNVTWNINFKILEDTKSVKGIDGDINLFNIAYEVESFKGVREDLIQDQVFLYMTLEGISGEFKTSLGENTDVLVKTMEKSLEVEHKNRTLIYGFGKTYYRSMTEGTIYALDEEGNCYEPTYEDTSMGEHYFTFNNLPVIDGYYTAVFEVPGSFVKKVKIPGGEYNKDGELVGTSVALTSDNFFVSGGMLSVSGDVNNDGAIDIYDLNEVVNLYGKSAEENTNAELCVDLSQDGVIDDMDVDIILYNYLKQDYDREDSKVPEEYIDGKDYIDLLISIGYYDDYIFGESVKANASSSESQKGEVVTITADIYQDGEYKEGEYGEYQYQFLVRNTLDSDWQILSQGYSSSATWTAAEAGDYEIKARVLNQYGAIIQDTIGHLVKDNSTENPDEPENPEDPNKPGDSDKPENPDKPSDPTQPDNPGNSDDSNNSGSIDNSSGNNSILVKPNGSSNKIPLTGGANALLTLMVAGLCLASGNKIRKSK